MLIRNTAGQLHLFKFVFLVLVIITAFHSTVLGADVKIAWDPNTESDLAGYKIYIGENSGIYTDEIDVGKTTQTVLTGLKEKTTYYFAAIAKDRDGNESGLSEELVYTTPELDTDGDGIPDRMETDYYGSNPHESDTDGDGIDDGAELDVLGDSWNSDADADGIINLLDKDSDNDGVSDGNEINSGSDPLVPIEPVFANQPPVSQADIYTTIKDEILSVITPNGVLSNDSDPDNDALEALLVDQPTNGSLNLKADGSFDYTPVDGFAGIDTFSYRSSDGSEFGNTATVTIEVLEAAADSQRTSEGLLALYDFREGSGTTVRDVSDVGTPLDLDITNPSAVRWETEGGLTLKASTAIRSAGPATKIINTVKNSGAITIETWITPANTNQFGPARIVALSKDAYPSGGNFVLGAGVSSSKRATYDARLRTTKTNKYGTPSLTSPNGAVSTELTHLVYTRASSGKTRLYINGSQATSGTTAGNFSNWGNYALGLGNEPSPERGNRPWLGTLHLVAVYDKALSDDEIVLNFDAGPATVIADQPSAEFDSGSDQPSYNSPPMATDDTFHIDADMDLVLLPSEGVLSNDSDPDGDALIAVLSGGTGPSSGSLVLNSDGSLTYKPYTGFSGSDQFEYQVEDPMGDKDIATVTIIVAKPKNAIPVSMDDTYSAQAYGDLFVNASEGVLSNDSDPEGNALEALLVNQPANGSLILKADGSFDYTPTTGFIGVDTFTYRCSDGSEASNTATVTIEVLETTADTTQQRTSKGLLVLYDFREGFGTTVQDLSGAGSPLNLNITKPSAVHWETDGGLTINASTAIRSSGTATKIINAVKNSQEITIEAWVTPANTTQFGPARIVALSKDAYPIGGNFVLGAGASSSKRATYDVRLRTTKTNNYGMPSLTSPNGMVSTELTHVVYTRGASGKTRLYINGSQAASGSTSGNLSNWRNYALGLGNEPYPERGSRPWLGTLHLVAIYSRSLSPEEVSLNYGIGF